MFTLTEFMPDGQRKENLRKPLEGKLIIGLKQARDLNHVPLSRKTSKAYNESTVVIKIEGNERGVSHPSRNDRWHEDFDIDVDKANEVELTIYDTPAGGEPAPIGMIWLRISDVVDALRRQKVGAESQGAGWVTAAATASIRGPQPNSSNSETTLHREVTRVGGPGGKAVDGLDGWFAVEPAGAISLHLDFSKWLTVSALSGRCSTHCSSFCTSQSRRMPERDRMMLSGVLEDKAPFENEEVMFTK